MNEIVPHKIQVILSELEGKIIVFKIFEEIKKKMSPQVSRGYFFFNKNKNTSKTLQIKMLELESYSH